MNRSFIQTENETGTEKKRDNLFNTNYVRSGGRVGKGDWHVREIYKVCITL